MPLGRDSRVLRCKGSNIFGMGVCHHAKRLSKSNVIQSEAKNLEYIHFMLSRFFANALNDKMFKLSFAPKFGQNRSFATLWMTK